MKLPPVTWVFEIGTLLLKQALPKVASPVSVKLPLASEEGADGEDRTGGVGELAGVGAADGEEIVGCGVGG